MRKDCFASLAMTLLIFCVSLAGCGKQENAPAPPMAGPAPPMAGPAPPMAGPAAQTDGDYSVLNPQRDFTLQDQDGKIFHLKDHRGQIILLFFGYTTCPDVCPTTLSKLARVYSLLGPMRQKVLTLFVTVDPQRDTPQKLKAYLQYFNINAMGLTGTKQEIDKVVDDYKAVYEKVETSSSALGYMFNHTDYLYLIDAQGKTAHLFHPEDTADDMAHIIKGL